jgi:hypothetical protein
MKKLLFILVLFSTAEIRAQDFRIILRNEPPPITIDDFYISSVVDGRVFRGNIGFVIIGPLNRKVPANLSGGLVDALFAYLSSWMLPDSTKTPVVMEVKSLEIEEMRGIDGEEGRIAIHVEFYRIFNDKLEKILETRAEVNEQAPDVTPGHEKRIRSVLDTCIARLNTNGLNLFVSTAGTDNILPESLPDSPDDAGKRYKSLLTYGKSVGVKAEGWGLTYQGFISSDESKWIIPWSLGMERFEINQDYFPSGYQKIKINYFMPGISVFRKIGGSWYTSTGMVFPVGAESGTDYSGDPVQHMIIGIFPAQGVLCIPKSKLGICIGFSFYARFLNSVVYKSDLGVKGEIGIKF